MRWHETDAESRRVSVRVRPMGSGGSVVRYVYICKTARAHAIELVLLGHLLKAQLIRDR